MNAIVPVSPDRAAFAACATAVMDTVAFSSGRVYAAVYRAWQTYADANGISPLELWPANVIPFLKTQAVSKSTRQMHLSALRKLVVVFSTASGDETAQRMYGTLKLVKAPNPDTPRPERQRRALKPKQVDKVMDAWNGQTPIHLRNRALMAVLFYVGVRRAEAAALRWNDIDLEEGVISIKHGKGDKAREAAIVDDNDNEGVVILRAWRAANPGEYVFPAAWKDGRMRADQPMSADAVYRIVRQTEERAGVPFRPHDARRTLITQALAQKVPLAEVQAQAGHAQASTTLRYAQATDARARRLLMHGIYDRT
jgi:integrase